MKTRFQHIGSYLLSTVFLLTLLLQSIHQIEHVCESSHSSQNQEDYHFEPVKKNHCEICDFIFSPAPELAITNFEFIQIQSEIISTYATFVQLFHSNKPLTHKQLRAPPFIV